MGLVSKFYRAFEVIPGYSAPDSLVNRRVAELEDAPDDWPEDALVSKMKKGRELFGDCPGCGATAVAANEAIRRGASSAECKACGAAWTSVSGLGAGEERFECVAGPDEIVGKSRAAAGWRNMQAEK